MLQVPYVPSHYAGHQTAYLLHNSEKFFPPLNAFCTLGNLVMTGLTYYYSRDAVLAAHKFPRLALATGLSVATTAYALLIMVPLNRNQAALASRLEEAEKSGEVKSESYSRNEKELRRLQSKWISLNYGRATLMIASAVAGMSALLVR